MRFFAPPVELAGCFTSFYLLEVDLAGGERVSDHLQPEWGNLRFFFGEAPETGLPEGGTLSGTQFTATGPSSAPVAFTLGRVRMWGIGLLPLGWAKFMDVPASTMADTVSDGMTHPAFARFVPLYDELHRNQQLPDEEQSALIGRFFLAHNRDVRHAETIAAINAALVSPEVHTAHDLADHAHVTMRTLERLCGRYFGFQPRKMIRRQRMMRTLAAFMLAEKATWARVIDLDYSDQSHFTREFAAFMRMSPSDYAAMEHPVIASFMAERARVMGSAAQTLDIPRITRPETDLLDGATRLR